MKVALKHDGDTGRRKHHFPSELPGCCFKVRLTKLKATLVFLGPSLSGEGQQEFSTSKPFDLWWGWRRSWAERSIAKLLGSSLGFEWIYMADPKIWSHGWKLDLDWRHFVRLLWNFKFLFLLWVDANCLSWWHLICISLTPCGTGAGKELASWGFRESEELASRQVYSQMLCSSGPRWAQPTLKSKEGGEKRKPVCLPLVWGSQTPTCTASSVKKTPLTLKDQHCEVSQPVSPVSGASRFTSCSLMFTQRANREWCSSQKGWQRKAWLDASCTHPYQCQMEVPLFH